MKANKPGVYMILHSASDTRYVGSSAREIRKRWYNHRRNLRKNIHPCQHLQNAWNKYGEDAFVFVVLENTSPECVLDAEQKWCILFKDAGFRLYNTRIDSRSQAGMHHSEDAKRKISKAHQGRIKSAEERANISRALKGRAAPWATIANAKDWPPLVAPDGAIYHVHNLLQFCEEHRLNVSALRHVLLGHRTNHKGWRLSLDGQGQPFDGKLRVIGVTHTIISPESIQYPDVTNIEAFARDHALDSSSLRKVAKGEYQHHKGWTVLREGYTPKTTSNRIPTRPRNFVAPDGTMHQVNGLGSFCIQHGLDKGAMLRVESGKQRSHKGWHLYTPTNRV